MLADILGAIQDSAIASALRGSRWAYPFVNTGHIVGLALLFGAILPMDLRLVGFWRSVPVAALARVLVPTAITGLAIAVVTGGLLFSVSATRYAGLTLFQVKLLLILCAVANAVLLRRAANWAAAREGAGLTISPRLRAAGLLSIGLWLATIVAGRMLGYLLN